MLNDIIEEENFYLNSDLMKSFSAQIFEHISNLLLFVINKELQKEKTRKKASKRKPKELTLTKSKT